MAFVRPRARILEISTTSGNGPYTVPGAGVDLSHNSFASFMNVGDSTEGYVAEPGVAMWTGILTRSATNQITLTAVEEAKGTFGAGTKEIGASPLASRAMLREDIAGAIVTGGNAVNYTVSSYRKYSTLAELDGNIIAFTPHATNTGLCQLSVDGIGFRPMRAVPGVELFAGTLIQGTPYLVLYNNTDQVFYLHGMFGNRYNVPLFGGMDYWDTIAPNSAFIFPAGQAISRTVYAAAFARWGTTYGPGDGSTTFNVPDKTGRVSAMKEATATRLTSTHFGGNSVNLGAVGGSESHTLTTAQLASHTHVNTLIDPGHVHAEGADSGSGGLGGRIVGTTGSGTNSVGNGNTTQAANTGITITNAAQGGGAAHPNVPPTIICNYIIRVI
jgi:microcystin-dependent protein